MPIVPSRAGRVHVLLRQLASERPAERDSAVARLTLLGPRVIDPLLASLNDGPTVARVAALEVLDRLDDPRARSALVAAVEDPRRSVAIRAMELAGERPEAACAAALARVAIRGSRSRRGPAVRALAQLLGEGVVEALDPLVDVLVDEEADTRLRLSVMDALLRLEPSLPRSTLRPLGRRLAASKEAAVAARAVELDATSARPLGEPGRSRDLAKRLREGEVTTAEARKIASALRATGEPPLERLHEALEQTEEPTGIEALAVILGTVGTPASIPILARALGRLADPAPHPDRRDDQVAARAAAHLALAGLDSRVALHDLRELIALRPQGAVPRVLEAAARVGDASLVPALARAASEDPELLGPCAATYAAIAARERLRRTSVALRKVRPEHRPALEAFLAARRPRRR